MNFFRRFFPAFIVLLVISADFSQALAEESFDIVTDVETAKVGLLAWSSDSELFSFVNTGLIISPTNRFAPRMPDSAWQAYNLTIHVVEPGTQLWPLQPKVTLSDFADAFPDQFLYASPDKFLFLYQRDAVAQIGPTIPGAAEVMIANAETGESKALGILSHMPFSPESSAKVLWATTNREVVFSTTSAGIEIVDALQIYHVSIISADPLEVLVKALDVQVDGIAYMTVNLNDRLLSITHDGKGVLLIGRQDPATSLKGTQPGKLILWRPSELTASIAIDVFDTDEVCQASFAPGTSTQLATVLDDGRIALYDTVTHQVQFLSARVGSGCQDRYFSPDGSWLAIPYNSTGQLAFLDINRLITEVADFP